MINGIHSGSLNIGECMWRSLYRTIDKPNRSWIVSQMNHATEYGEICLSPLVEGTNQAY
jgi:hypothetical protein